MFVELRGVGTRNKGAEMMLRAASTMLSRSTASVRVVVDPSLVEYRARAAYLAWGKLRGPRRLEPMPGANWLMQLVPTRFCDRYGIAKERQIPYVLDASGFAYGDQWGQAPTTQLLRELKRRSESLKGVVLLPQAFGPFSSASFRQKVREVMKRVDLVFARDHVSYAHIQELGPFENVSLAPDFTNLVEGQVPPSFQSEIEYALVVPNTRMLKHTERRTSSHYIECVARCIEILADHGITCFVLLHANEDLGLAEPLQDACSVGLRVIREDDPIYLKGIIKNAHLVVASRYHAVIGALSQGVPCFTTSWSHKYEMLLEDYHCRELLLDPNCTVKELETSLSHAIDSGVRKALCNTLDIAAREQKEYALRMWGRVADLLGVSFEERNGIEPHAALAVRDESVASL